MAEVTASSKFACPACGAEATWNPGKKALVCGFCGTVSPVELKTEGKVVEHDLHEGLTPIKGRETGLDRAGIEVKCQSFQAISEFEPNRVAQNCEFCGSAALVPYQDVNEVIRPEKIRRLPAGASRPERSTTARRGRPRSCVGR